MTTKKNTTTPVITIEKAWDGNVTERGSELNGRIYTGVMGWRWIVSVDDVVHSDYDRLGEAEHFVRTTFGDAAVPKRTRATKSTTTTTVARDVAADKPQPTGRCAKCGARTMLVVCRKCTKATGATSDECPKCSRCGAGPLCKFHRVLTVDEKVAIERARRARKDRDWSQLPVVQCATCDQKFKREHDAQTQCRDCMSTHDDGFDGFTFYTVDAAERAAWNTAMRADADDEPIRTRPDFDTRDREGVDLDAQFRDDIERIAAERLALVAVRAAVVVVHGEHTMSPTAVRFVDVTDRAWVDFDCDTCATTVSVQLPRSVVAPTPTHTVYREDGRAVQVTVPDNDDAPAGRFKCHNLVHDGSMVCGLPTDHPSGVCDICRRALINDAKGGAL